MNLRSILEIVQSSALGEWMRYSGAAPIVESFHVVAAVLLFGTVLVVDLRLLGLADSRLAFTRISRQTLPLTWLAFAIAVLTGGLMFIASAVTFFGNTAFRLKVLALCGAGLNMAIFQAVTARRLAAWDESAPTPRAAKIAGLVSVLLWASVVLLGRWIGFTKGYDFTIPSGIELGFGP